MNITFTAAASTYIKTMIEKKQGLGFRLSVKKTGCSGYSYLPSIVDKVIATDLVLNIADGVTVFVDATWLSMLEGVQVDYVEEDKSGLKQKRLVFNNPNESSRCGCGESFHIE
jgi:iron-sulfur cluster assembly protein